MHAIFTAKDKDIYHVTVMPCFDKKLEAARQEFQIESNGRIVKDVDCVLATTEIEKLLTDNLGDDELESVAAAFEHEDNSSDFVYSHRGGGSGGYLDYVYQSASESLFGKDRKSY